MKLTFGFKHFLEMLSPEFPQHTPLFKAYYSNQQIMLFHQLRFLQPLSQFIRISWKSLCCERGRTRGVIISTGTFYFS